MKFFKGLKRQVSFDPARRVKIRGVVYKHFKGFWSRDEALKCKEDLERRGSKRFPPVVKEVRVSPLSRKARFYVCVPILKGGN